MYARNILRLRGIAATALVVLTSSVASQAQQKSAKELIAGNWVLMLADNVRRDGSATVPGFGPLPKGERTVWGRRALLF